ncbi:MAG: 3-hydroxyacyl-CoA dehydrogenase/enoyl-CoA hydratase family protein [Anaerolineales bacterium]
MNDRPPIQNCVVLGSGTMGASIAAHLANAGLGVLLLDVLPSALTAAEAGAGKSLADEAVRDRIAREGLVRAQTSRPASFFSRVASSRVRVGNLADDLDQAGRADWVIEAVVEDLAIKQDLFRRLERNLAAETVVSTNTSGLPIAAIAEGMSESFRRRFLGTHFFNPPRYLPLLETIPLPDTEPEVVAQVEAMAAHRLGKTVVRAKDTPNFIANRLGSVAGAFVLDYALRNGYSVEEVDALTGPLIGRPKTATFRLFDWVGLDVASAVRGHLAQALPQDESTSYLQSEPADRLVAAMAERGWLGNKSGAGFYRRVVKDGVEAYWPLDLETLEHRPPRKPEMEGLSRVQDVPEALERVRLLLDAHDRGGELVRAVLFHGLAYASRRIPEIADTPQPIDLAVRAGFAHERGPFELWDRLGVAEAAERMAAAGSPAADWVTEMLDRGQPSFYEGGIQVIHPASASYQRLPERPLEISLAARRSEGREIEANEGASLIDLGDDVAVLQIRSKGNSLDEDVLTMLDVALARTESEFAGLIVTGQGEDFSLGANLFLLAAAAQSSQWDSIDSGIRALQGLGLRLRSFPRPVVMALAGRVLGGGAELAMAGSRVVAAAETYVGLVETAAGLIPAGGGCKELLRRIVNPSMQTEHAGALAFVQRVFETIGQSRVGTSAEESRILGYVGPADRIVMNRQHTLAEAKREVLHMATGFRPAGEERVYAAGRDVLAALRVGVFMAHEAAELTDYEVVIGNKLAEVLTGGDLSRPTWVSESYFLEREREAFLSLCGEEKTQQRMWHLLQHKKPLRN